MDEVMGSLVYCPNFPSVNVLPRDIWIWTPKQVDPKSANKFNILFCHDGQNLFDPALSYSGVDWGLDETLSRLTENGEVSPTLVVAIANTRQRVLEYMPQKALERTSGERIQLKIDQLRIKGDVNSDSYLRFIFEELKPYVEKNFPTHSDFGHAYMMGSSMGGLVSMYALCEYPNILSGVACISTHWPIGEGASLRYFRNHIPIPNGHKFYFDYGTRTLDSQYAMYQKRADRILREKGYQPGKDWVTWKWEDADHSEKSWRERLETPLKFLLG
jgi:predicted alpha/beta superfamily hydrolase